MQVLFSSDTHVHPAHLKRLLLAAEKLQPAVLLLGGDLIPDWAESIPASIEPHRNWVANRLLPALRDFRERFPGIQVLLDLGNDDLMAARPLLEEHDGGDFQLLHRSVVEVAPHLAVAGYMAVNPTPFRAKDLEKPDCRDSPGLGAPGVRSGGITTRSGTAEPVVLDPLDGTIEDDLDELAAVLDSRTWANHRFLFVSHAPPRNSALDVTAADQHVGSLGVRRFIERLARSGRLIAALHGHIHESPWQSRSVWDNLAGTPCFNVGQVAPTLRALWFDTTAPLASARVVLVSKSKEVTVLEKGEAGLDAE